MRISSKEISRFDIPLCQMVYMPLVRPILANDIKYSNDRKWHYLVDNICLDARSKGGLLLNAMHDINK
jgi:hypothetical protein